MDENGVIYSTIANTSADSSAEIKCQIADSEVKEIEAEILTGAIDAYNSFENKDAVKTVKFENFSKTADGFTAEIPACSVVKFIIKR